MLFAHTFIKPSHRYEATLSPNPFSTSSPLSILSHQYPPGDRGVAGVHAVPHAREVFECGTGHARMETTAQILGSKQYSAIHKFHALLTVSTVCTVNLNWIDISVELITAFSLSFQHKKLHAVLVTVICVLRN